MKIGIAGPVSTEPLREFLDPPDNDAPSGLGGTCVVQLVTGLLKAGNRVSVYSLDPGVKKPVILRGQSLTIHYGEFRPRHRMRDLMSAERNAIRQFIEADEPDIVNAHWTYEFALGALSAARPTLITVHDWAPAVLMHNPTLYRLGRMLLNYATILRGTRFSAVSPYLQKRLQRFTGKPVTLIPNLLENKEFRSGARTVDSVAPCIISMNNGFGRLKNVKALIRAFGLIRKEMPAARLLLVGHDYGRGETAMAWAERRGLSTGIEFAGFVSHQTALTLLEETDLLIHPSLEESFGLTLLEAMSVGTPVIAGERSGAVPWLLDGGNAGVITNIRSPESIAAEALALLRDSDRWQRYSTHGRDHVWTHFRSEVVLERYLSAYRSVREEAGGRG